MVPPASAPRSRSCRRARARGRTPAGTPAAHRARPAAARAAQPGVSPESLVGIRLPQLHRLRLASDSQVEDLDEDRERHREVDVALRRCAGRGRRRSATRRSAAGSSARASSRSGGGRRSRRLPSADTIMTPTASTTAVTITARSLAMPTAVMTESSENTMSSSMTWMMTAANEAATRDRRVPLVALRACRESRRSPSRSGTGRRRSG